MYIYATSPDFLLTMAAVKTFAALKKNLSEDVVSQVDAIYRFDIKTDDGVKSWMVDLKNGCMYALLKLSKSLSLLPRSWSFILSYISSLHTTHIQRDLSQKLVATNEETVPLPCLKLILFR